MNLIKIHQSAPFANLRHLPICAISEEMAQIGFGNLRRSASSRTNILLKLASYFPAAKGPINQNTIIKATRLAIFPKHSVQVPAPCPAYLRVPLRRGIDEQHFPI